MKTRSDFVARSPECSQGSASPRRKGLWPTRRRACAAAAAGLLPLLCTPAGAQYNNPFAAGGNGTSAPCGAIGVGRTYNSASNDAAVSSSGTPFGPTGTAPGATSGGQYRPITASVAITETLTNNVNLTSSATAQGDLVSLITPTLAIDMQGDRTCLRGGISAPAAIYVKTGGNDKIYPSVSLFGSAEILERIFFIDAAILATEQFLTPFGAQPADLSNATQNRYISSNYRVSPYIRGVTSDGIRY